jgi:hypothetical protein
MQKALGPGAAPMFGGGSQMMRPMYPQAPVLNRGCAKLIFAK